MSMAKKQRYFVHRNDFITIQCPHCGRKRIYRCEQLISRKHSSQLHCFCSATLEVELEFRQDYRKKTAIPGTIRAVSTPKNRARACIIADQSASGLGLLTSEYLPIAPNDHIIVSYRPLRQQAKETERLLQVRHFSPGKILGGMFIS